MRVQIMLSILFMTFSTAVIADRTDEQQFFDKVRDKIQKNCANSPNYMQCRDENSPRKCKGLAFNEDLGGWARCVRSCGNAGIISRTIGECS